MKSPSVELFIDGTRVPDGCLTAPADSPAALTGVTIYWGRETTIDQPAPASLDFELMDRPGGLRFLDVVHLGSLVTVQASATVVGAPTLPTLTAPLNVAASGATALAAAWLPIYGAELARFIITPGPYPGSPAAWDAVPRSGAAQSWRVTLTVTFAAYPANQGLTVRPLLFSSPADTHPLAMPPLTVTNGVVDTTFSPEPGYWVGLEIVWQPMGPQWDQLPATSWDTFAAIAWDDFAKLTIGAAQIYAPPAGAARQNQVFSGRVTDQVTRYDETIGATIVRIYAQDDLAELSNRNITNQAPWLVEMLPARWGRVLTGTGLTVQTSTPASAATTPVSWRDIDNQPALTLLRDLARTVDGFVYAATHLGTGPTVNLYAMGDRPALNKLSLVGGVIVIIPGASFDAAGVGVKVTACAVELDPIQWRQTVSDIATGITVDWREQTKDDKGNEQPTDRSAILVDTTLEKAWGARRIQTRTELTTSTAALLVAENVLGRLSQGAWVMDGVTIDTGYQQSMAPALLDAVMRMLDATTRIGLPVLLTDIPAWAPTPTGNVATFIEGGRYRNVDGAWVLSLFLSSASASGAAPIKWDDLPVGWKWDQFDPGIRWIDLQGATV